MRNNHHNGFTLMEMLLVLLIISALTVLVLPNIVQTKDTINEKTCEAYLAFVNTQLQIYALDHDGYPESLQTLIDEGYIKTDRCPDGRMLILDPETNKEVFIKDEESI